MENVVKIILGKEKLMERDNTVLEDTIRIETERLDEIIPAEDVEKAVETMPEGTEMRKGCELIVGYMKKYLKPKMTYRELYCSLKESEQLLMSEMIYKVIEEIKNMFNPAQA